MTMHHAPSNELLASAEVRHVELDDVAIAYRQVGSGGPLVLVHGWPLTGMTFRHVVPALAAHFTCYVLDLPGAGESCWNERTDFGMKAQAEAIKAFVDALALPAYAVLAHDTGATIARALAIVDRRITKLVAIGTEIPNHRPPFIPMFQRLSYLPGSDAIFKLNMQSDRFLFSPRGFGGCFVDRSLIKGEFHDLFIAPVIASPAKRSGQRFRLRGIDWKLVDSLARGHAQIQAPVLLIWGEDDPVFPLARAKEMVPQFKDCRGVAVIPKAKLFVQEEFPDDVTRLSLEFLRA